MEYLVSAIDKEAGKVTVECSGKTLTFILSQDEFGDNMNSVIKEKLKTSRPFFASNKESIASLVKPKTTVEQITQVKLQNEIIL